MVVVVVCSSTSLGAQPQDVDREVRWIVLYAIEVHRVRSSSIRSVAVPKLPLPLPLPFAAS